MSVVWRFFWVQAWAVVEQYAAPVLQKAPFLNMPVRLVRRWFTPPQ